MSMPSSSAIAKVKASSGTMETVRNCLGATPKL